jgi:ferredoxin, 2Fe-2S
MAKIHVTNRDGVKLEVQAREGATLTAPLRDISGGFEALCGGNCSCSTCHIFVDPEWAKKLPAPRDDEQDLLEGTEHYREGQSRLACQLKVSPALDGMVVTIAPAE